MRLNEINKDHAVAVLDADDLVWLHNVLYFYEKHCGIYPDYRKPDAAFHGLAKQAAIARDLCQYGNLDGHALGVAAAHELVARPEGGLAKRLEEILRAGQEGQEPQEG